jgi:hypothetical protein
MMGALREFVVRSVGEDPDDFLARLGIDEDDFRAISSWVAGQCKDYPDVAFAIGFEMGVQFAELGKLKVKE